MVLYFGNVVQKFAAVHGIMKMLLETAKCTGSIGEHVGEFASMKELTLGSCHLLQIQHKETVGYK